jgi:hypothetical protein
MKILVVNKGLGKSKKDYLTENYPKEDLLFSMLPSF